MRFYSTNRVGPTVSLRQAVLQGLADDGGLFLPESIPTLPQSYLSGMHDRSFQKVAFDIAKHFLEEDISEHVLKVIVQEAIHFDAPLVELSDRVHVLELFHGPTLSFKDFGARFMARLISHFIMDSDRQLTILVATSGDTGSAVAHGFFEVPAVRIILLYPSGRVSEIQEKQLTTLGGNVTALEIQGTFDDCQSLVKKAFSDENIKKKLWLSSANSINIARLIPQSFYYFYAFYQLGGINSKLVFSVPSGNYGNLTAGLIAKRMGLPVLRFVAASNANDVVPEYLRTGTFRPRPSLTTLSNAMDVGNPSNFARILALYGNVEEMRKDIYGTSFSDEQTTAAIQEIYKTCGYVSEPHGAVGYLGLKEYAKGSPEVTGIFLETAHPAKFSDLLKQILGRNIEIPERLRISLDKPKISILLPNRFDELKQFLLSSA